MDRDQIIPQGSYKIGRDLPEGVYLVAGLTNLTFVYVIGPKNNDEQHKHESYTLDNENAKMAHIRVENGDNLGISGRVIIRQISRFIEDNKCNLFDEIASFENDLKARGVKLTTKKYEFTK